MRINVSNWSVPLFGPCLALSSVVAVGCLQYRQSANEDVVGDDLVQSGRADRESAPRDAVLMFKSAYDKLSLRVPVLDKSNSSESVRTFFREMSNFGPYIVEWKDVVYRESQVSVSEVDRKWNGKEWVWSMSLTPKYVRYRTLQRDWGLWRDGVIGFYVTVEKWKGKKAVLSASRENLYHVSELERRLLAGYRIESRRLEDLNPESRLRWKKAANLLGQIQGDESDEALGQKLVEEVNALKLSPVTVNAQDGDGLTLIDVASKGSKSRNAVRMPVVKSLLKLGYDVNHLNSKGETVLYRLVSPVPYNLALAAMFTRFGTDVNLIGEDSMTVVDRVRSWYGDDAESLHEVLKALGRKE